MSGTTQNVFGIQVGVGITVAVRRTDGGKHQLHYHRVPENWRKEEKLQWLSQKEVTSNVEWETLPSGQWLAPGLAEFEQFIPIGTKQGRSAEVEAKTIFKTYSLGVSTNREEVVYGYDRIELAKRMEQFCEDYRREHFLKVLDEEITYFQNEFQLYLQREVQVPGEMSGAQLLPPAEDLDRLLRYETHLERLIEHKIQQLYARRSQKATVNLQRPLNTSSKQRESYEQ